MLGFGIILTLGGFVLLALLIIMMGFFDVDIPLPVFVIMIMVMVFGLIIWVAEEEKLEAKNIEEFKLDCDTNNGVLLTREVEEWDVATKTNQIKVSYFCEKNKKIIDSYE